MRYTVDYGHALVGSVGARGCGYKEEICTREIGRLVTKKLRDQGHTVDEIYLDNAVDMRTDLDYRVNKINSIKPDLSISIHLNAFSDESSNGVEVWADSYSWNTAKNICNEISRLGYFNRGVKDGSDSLALVGLYGGTSPALLVECCFITNANDMSKYNAEKISSAIVKGITGRDSTHPQWKKNDTGWWYDLGNGNYPKSQWYLIENEWYYFNRDGYALCFKWEKIGDDWYYFKQNCVMAKSEWIKINDKYYFVKENGVMATGWVHWKGMWYYLNDITGEMLTNVVKDSWLIDKNGVATKK